MVVPPEANARRPNWADLQDEEQEGEGADQSEAQERNPRVAQTEFWMSAQEARTFLDNQRLARIYADAVRDAQVPTQAAEVSSHEPLSAEFSAELVAVRDIRREQWERHSTRANPPKSIPLPHRGAPAVPLREA